MSLPNRIARFHVGWSPVFLMVFCLTANLRAATEPDPFDDQAVPGSMNAFHDVLGDYRAYYAEREPLCFASIVPGNPGPDYGVHLAFDSNTPGFHHVEGAEEGGVFHALAANTIFIPFDGQGEAVQEKTIRVRPVFDSGKSEPIYTIRVNCTTRRAFRKMGADRNRDIVKVFCEPRLNYGVNRPENWKSFRPTAADVAFAQKQWGALVQGVTSDYAKARILTKALSRDLHGCGGTPSALVYALASFDKYRAIRAGRTKFACAQYAEIFSMMCNCFGVVNRWGFNNDGLQNDAVLIELGSSHLVTEIFDRELNQWVFLDGMMNALGAYLGDVGPLTLHEVFLFINQPNRRPHLNILSFDPVTGNEKMLPVDESPAQFYSYRGWTKGYHTAYQPATGKNLP